MHGNKIRLLKNGKKYQTHVFGRMHINMQMSEVSLKFLVGVTFSELELIYTVFFPAHPFLCHDFAFSKVHIYIRRIHYNNIHLYRLLTSYIFHCVF